MEDRVVETKKSWMKRDASNYGYAIFTVIFLVSLFCGSFFGILFGILNVAWIIVTLAMFKKWTKKDTSNYAYAIFTLVFLVSLYGLNCLDIGDVRPGGCYQTVGVVGIFNWLSSVFPIYLMFPVWIIMSIVMLNKWFKREIN